VLACGIALDPLAEMWVHELKGSGDLDPLHRVSHRFVSGVDDEAVGYAAESCGCCGRRSCAAPSGVRTFYLNMAGTERVAARALREAAGTVTGHATGSEGEGPRDVLTDVLAVFAATPGSSGATSPRGSPPGSRSGGTAPPATRSRPSAAPVASRPSTSAAAVARRRAAAARLSRPRQAPGEPPHAGRPRPSR
jgi:hypothetical protein